MLVKVPMKDYVDSVIPKMLKMKYISYLTAHYTLTLEMNVSLNSLTQNISETLVIQNN